MKDKTIFIAAVIIAVSVALAIVGYFVLPDVVVIQFTLTGGAGNTAPKIVALLIPFLLSTVCSILFYKLKNSKYLLVSLLGLVVSIIMMITNL